LTSTQAFTIATNDINEAPTALSLVIPASLNENVITTAGIKVSDITIADDALKGGSGDNTIYGGGGNDVFVFDANSIAQLITGINTIGDFTVNQDKIQLSKLAFTTLSASAGSLADFNSQSGTGDFSIVTSDAAADTAVNAIVYNKINGKLFYNTDGVSVGVGNSNQFAQLATGLDLHGTDFIVVGNSLI
jgi:Ca2+-binding RTX toxin-like protein